MRTPTASSRFLTRLIAGFAAGSVAALTVGVVGAGTASAAPAEGAIANANAANAIKDRYIVVLNDDVRTGAAHDLAARVGGTVTAEYSAAVNGFTVALSERVPSGWRRTRRWRRWSRTAPWRCRPRRPGRPGVWTASTSAPSR